MYTRKLSIGIAILPLFIALTLSASSSSGQNYHYKIATAAQCGTVDSMAAAHLQVSIQQTDVAAMRFRITIQNPIARTLSVSIRRGNDLLFEDVSSKPTYDGIFNLSDLEDGSYTILVSNGKERVARTLHIQTQTTVDRQLTVE